MHNEKWVLYNWWWTTQLSDWEEAPKYFPKSNCTKKRSWSLFDGLLLVWLQLSEYWWNHYIWKVCSANQWDAWKPATPMARTGQQKGRNCLTWQWPITCCSTSASKLEPIELAGFASSSTFTWSFAANRPPLLQASWQLLQGKCFHNQQEAKNTFQEFIESQNRDFYATRMNKLIADWQKCVDFNGSYFDY